METFNPGYCTIESALLISHSGDEENITGMIGNFSLLQSMGSVALSGEIEILDGVGLINSLPIRGEEGLKIQLRCHDLQTEVKLNLQVIEISDVVQQPGTGDMYAYVLKFITKSSFNAAKQNVITAFRDKKASFAVNNIFKKYYKPSFEATRKFNVEESDGNMRIIIPDYTPQEAMKFLAAKAFSSKSKSATYRFFETVRGYNWVTDEWLLAEAQKSEIKKLKYSAVVDRNPLDGAVIMETLESFNQASHVSTLEDMHKGAYKNVVMEIDLTTHKKREFHYDYLKKKGSYKGMQGQIGGISGGKHSVKFINDTFTKENSPQSIVYRDWTPTGKEVAEGQVNREEQHMTEIIQNRKAYNYHMTNNMCSASMRGRIDLTPGEVINLSIVEPNATLSGEQNKRLSGYYLIYATAHNMTGDSLETNLQLVKFDWETDL